ncbi:MAG: PHP domain-containing protein [Fibrella sp.]|nr:PHP domain-containing protein [Armatimonadota bacterium]
MPILSADARNVVSADFHTHTTASDGTATPEELARTATDAGLSYLAVTDHDTAKAVGAVLAEAHRIGGLKIVPGVEISARGKPGSCHLLGLGVDYLRPSLNDTLADLLTARNNRNELLADRLSKLGVPVTVAEVRGYAPIGANLGRPHFAQTLLAKGYVSSLQEAFERYLGDNAAGFIPKEDLSPADAIALIHSVGGLSFLAHPGLLSLSQHETMDTRIKAYKDAGLMGVEAYYSRHTPAETNMFLRLAQKYDLLVTGGSDYHGANRPGTYLNRVLNEGTEPLPANLLPEILLEKALGSV